MADTDYKIKIHRQNRRNLLMKTISGGVVVYIPRWLKPDSPEVMKFIHEGLAQIESRIPPARAEILTRDEIREMAALWAVRMDVQPKRVAFRAMRRKWGSCSSTGNVNLNSALCTVPRELAEYVVVHELAHLRVFNHSKAFWALVGQHMPDYEVRRKTLDTYPV
ncbi:MAG TPA: M48 family metallopeptidase [Phototrophicaceae bacterium]|nr:M48 family metallopeptidase [Phototrophicaceae bacterium]